jgi:hypothetical protein
MARALGSSSKNSNGKVKRAVVVSDSKKEADKAQKSQEIKMPPIYVPNSYNKYLREDLPNKRLLLEKYFLLNQKQKLERLRNPSPRIQQFKKIIRRQLRIINRQLNGGAKFGIIQDFV